MKEYFEKKIQDLQSQSLRRVLKTISSDQGAEVTHDGKKYLNFSSNNYLGLANLALLRQSSIMAIQKYGTGTGASRLITGTMTLHEQLEKEVAQFKDTEAALIFNSGYQANVGIVSAVAEEGDFIFSDELNHASLIDGCRLSKAKTRVYRHVDMLHLEQLLQASLKENQMSTVGKNQKRLIVTDSVFSMEGDIAPLVDIMSLAEKYDAMVLVDEAHATGVLGLTGRGALEHQGVSSRHPRLIQMGTFGKALGSLGAYVCGPQSLIDWLINCARPFVYSTSLPPAVLAANSAALRFVASPETIGGDWRDLRRALDCNRQVLKEKLGVLSHQKNMTLLGGDSPIFALVLGDAERTMQVSQALFQKGIWAGGIRPPTVPKNTARIRLTLMATHTGEHLDRLMECLEEVL